MAYVYTKDQELAAYALDWQDGQTKATIDYSSGWTCTVKIVSVDTPGTILATKTTGITLAATSPNVLIDWTASDFTALPAATGGTRYAMWVYARRTSDSKDRVFSPGNLPTFTLYPAPA